MADTQAAPAPDTNVHTTDGSLNSATEALLGLLEPEAENPETEEAAPTEEEESTEEIQDESLEEESDDELEAQAEDESEEPDESEEAEEELLYAVKVDGDEQEVSLDELLNGYSRQSSYTKRSQQLAEQRKEFENAQKQMAAEYHQIQAERQQYVDSLQQVIEGSTANLDQYQSIDWDRLKVDDPVEWTVKRQEFYDAQNKIQATKAQQAEAIQRAQAEFQQQHQVTLQQEHGKMVEVLPEWADAEKQMEIATGIRNYATAQGFQKEELDSLSDHRSLLVLRKAMLYDQLQKADVKGKKLKGKPRVIRSGRGAEKKQTQKSQRAAKIKRLQSTGHLDDAASVIEDLMEL